MRRSAVLCAVAVILMNAMFSPAAGLKLAPLFTDHAVLQAGLPVPIWGTANPREKISVSFSGQKHETQSDDAGNWRVVLDPLKGGEGGDLQVRRNADSLTLKDVLAGEVWLCSGQSNMQFTVHEGLDAANEIATSANPSIRFFNVPHKGSSTPEPAEFVEGNWQVCSPQTTRDCSAVAFFFARDLNHALKVPIGIVHSSWGGTPIQPWMSVQALKDVGVYDQLMAQKKKEMDDWPAQEAALKDATEKWEQQEKADRAAGRPSPPKPWNPGPPDSIQYMPAALYNGMIHPLAPYAIRGVLWYQGESNAGDEAAARQYSQLLGGMISNWRQLWGGRAFPFYIVQLPNWSAGDDAGLSWAYFREAQAAVLSAPNTAMAVTIDVGERDNIHPHNKQAVGNRLALIAEAKQYGRNVIFSGPTLHDFVIEGDSIRLHFDNVAQGLVARVQPMKSFAIAGPDHQFHPADAKIDGSDVVVNSPTVPHPEAVRYAFFNNPVASLFNSAGLPAAPFRTDDWSH